MDFQALLAVCILMLGIGGVVWFVTKSVRLQATESEVRLIGMAQQFQLQMQNALNSQSALMAELVNNLADLIITKSEQNAPIVKQAEPAQLETLFDSDDPFEQMRQAGLDPMSPDDISTWNSKNQVV